MQKNEKSLAQELKRCKPTVTFMALKILKKGGLLITPKEYKDTNALLQPWPENAFGGNIYVHLAKGIDFRPWLCLNKFSEGNHISKIKTELDNQNILIEGLHRHTKGQNLLTTLIKFKTVSEKSEKYLLSSGIIIEGKKYTVRKYIAKTHMRCTNCQLLGHLRSTCKNEKKCVRCASTTCKPGDCKNPFRKCVNCGGNHSSAYKNCEKMKTFTKTKFHQEKTKSYAAIVKTNAKQLTKLNTELIEIKNKLAYPKKTNLENDEEFTSSSKTLDLKELTTSLSKTLNLEKSKTKALAEWLSNLIQILTGTISTVSSISNDP